MKYDITSKFELDYYQTKLLFFIQYDLTYIDIVCEKNNEKAIMKLDWLNKWSKNIMNVLLKINKDDKKLEKLNYKNINDINIEGLNDNIKQTKKIINTMDKSNKFAMYLIYMECQLFKPYFRIDTNKNNKCIDNIKRKFNKENSLKYNTDGICFRELKNYANLMNISDAGEIDFIKEYKKAVNRISNKNKKFVGGIAIGSILLAITAGFAAPAIGAIIAPSGLYGAAAASAGLAALGGGAIAIGGLGVSGGIGIVVGGGAILGAITGGVASNFVTRLIELSSEFTLSQVAKVEVVTKKIIIKDKNYIGILNDLIKKQRNIVIELEDKIIELKKEKKSSREEIKNLSISIKYINRLIYEIIRTIKDLETE